MDSRTVDRQVRSPGFVAVAAFTVAVLTTSTALRAQEKSLGTDQAAKK
jgi:hypothetical protein